MAQGFGGPIARGGGAKATQDTYHFYGAGSWVRWLVIAVIATAALFSPAAAQEIEPQTVLLRVDAMESREDITLRAACGGIIRKLGFAEAEVITEVQLRVVDLCPRGFLVVETPTWWGTFPLRKVTQHERAGVLGGLLLCVDSYLNTKLLTFAANVQAMPLSCGALP